MSICSKACPVPIATQDIASSATYTGIPVLLLISLSRPFNREPPPAITMPLSLISAESSGGVLSSTECTASAMAETGSESASSISSEVTSMVFGSPEIRFLPLTSTLSCSSLGNAVPAFIFSSSAVLSPIIILCFFLIYLTMASSNLSPAILMEVDTTIPPRDITAMSVVPPPISNTMLPLALDISKPAPIADAIGSSISLVVLAPALLAASITALFSTSVTPLGTQTTILGLIILLLPIALSMKYLSIFSVMS